MKFYQFFSPHFALCFICEYKSKSSDFFNYVDSSLSLLSKNIFSLISHINLFSN